MVVVERLQKEEIWKFHVIDPTIHNFHLKENAEYNIDNSFNSNEDNLKFISFAITFFLS